MILVTGGPDSGKSTYAEGLLSECEAERKYYIATMKVCDEDSRRRMEKHRKAREGKGFITLEIPYRVDRAAEEIPNASECAALLECSSNLAGNELYDDPERALFADPGEGSLSVTDTELSRLAAEITADVRKLKALFRELIVVASVFPEEDAGYDDRTRAYVRLNRMLIDRLKEEAERVVEL